MDTPKQRWFAVTLWTEGADPTGYRYMADDSIHAIAVGMDWAKEKGFTLMKGGRKPKLDNKMVGGYRGEFRRPAYIQMTEIPDQQ